MYSYNLFSSRFCSVNVLVVPVLHFPAPRGSPKEERNCRQDIGRKRIHHSPGGTTAVSKGECPATLCVNFPLYVFSEVAGN